MSWQLASSMACLSKNIRHLIVKLDLNYCDCKNYNQLGSTNCNLKIILLDFPQVNMVTGDSYLIRKHKLAEKFEIWNIRKAVLKCPF